MQARSSSTSSSIPSLSYSDSQFCLTGRQISSELSDAFKESVAIGRPRTTSLGAEKTMVEGQCAEVESDSDSGKGTILSDNLESPLRESPPSFPPVHDWNSSRFSPQRNPNGRTDIITDHEELYGEEYEKENTKANASYSIIKSSVSSTSEISYDHGMESPSAVSPVSRFTHPGIFRSVKGSHRVQSPGADIGGQDHDASYSAEELLASRFCFAEPGFAGASDKNNNNLPVQLFSGRYNETAMTRCYSTDTNTSDQRRLSYNKDIDDLYDSKETMTTYCNNNNYDNNDKDDDDMRRQLKAKCQYLYGSRGSDFGSREMNYTRFGSGQDIGRGYSEYQQYRCSQDAPTMHRDRKPISTGSTTHDLFRLNDDDATDVTSSYHDTIGGHYGNRRQSNGNNNVRYLSLNEPLSTAARKDWFPADSNPTGDRGNTGHQSVSGFDQWTSDPNGRLRARRRWQETSFNSTIDLDDPTEGAAAFPNGHPPSAGQYHRSRSVQYGYEPVELPWKCDRGINSPKFPIFEADYYSATLPRQSKTPWGAQRGEPGQGTPLGPDKDPHRRRHHTARRWTNSGPLEEVVPAPSNPNPKSSRRVEFDFSTSKRQQRSMTSIAPEDGLRREGGSRPARFDLEMVDLDPSKSSSVQNTPTSSSSSSTRTVGPLSRGSSFPVPDGRRKPSSPGISFIQKIRSRLTGRSGRSDSLGTIAGADEHFGATARHHDAAAAHEPRHQGTSAHDDRPRVGCCDGLPGDVSPVVKATGMLLRFNSLQESGDDKESNGKEKNFSTLQHQKPKTEINQSKSGTAGENTAKRTPTASNSHVNTSSPAAAAAAAAESVVGFESAGQFAAASSEVSTTLSELDGLASQVIAHAALVPEPDDRTISEDEFDGCRQRMIESLKDFIENCKLMVIRTPATSVGFADDINRCCRLLDVVVARYRPLVDCSSLPADRARFAEGVGAVATSFRETVVAASTAAGLTAKHPAVRTLRARSGRLVVDLTELMRMVRDMSYNRISRRF